MSRYGNDPIDFGPAEDDYRGYDLGAEETARGPLILALATGVLIVFAAVVWNTYRHGVRPDPDNLPLITAEAEPYKRLPQETGGRVASDQELRFYDELDGSSRGASDPVDALRRSVSAGPDEVLAGGTRGEEIPAPATGDTGHSTNGAQEEIRAAIGAPWQGAPDSEEPRIAALDEATRALAAEQAARVNAMVAPTLRAGSIAEPRFEFDYDGRYMVQIAALRDEDRAEATWEIITARHPDIFHGAQKRIQRADLGARGVFYRLRAGAFDSRDQANAFCGAIKSSGNDCIVVQ